MVIRKPAVRRAGTVLAPVPTGYVRTVVKQPEIFSSRPTSPALRFNVNAVQVLIEN